MPNNYICALDIGSSKIAAVLASIKKNRIEDIFFDSIPSGSVKFGAVVDSIELVNSVTRLLKALRQKCGINVKHLNINITGKDIVTRHSKAVIPLAEKGNKVVNLSDVRRVIEQARILGSSLEEEIIHAIPLGYSIDSKADIANPLGLYTHRLEVDLYLVCARLSSIQNLNRVINQSGYEIKELYFSGLATSKMVLSQEFKQGLNLFCDIGSDTTELLLFRGGAPSDIRILPIGGDDFTAALQQELKIPLDLAQEIKISQGVIGNPQRIGEDKEILIKRSNLYKPIKQRLVSDVLTSRAKAICGQIKDAVKDLAPVEEVNNLVVVGRGVLLEGFIETLEDTLRVPVKLGRITSAHVPASIREDRDLSGQKYLTYLTALGLLCEALKEKTQSALPFQPAKNFVLNTINRFKEVYQDYF